MKIVDFKTNKRTKLHIKICPICKNEYGTYLITRKTCSKKCGYELVSISKKRGEYRNCVICKNSFYAKSSDDRRNCIRKFCSRKCMNYNKKLDLPVGQWYSYDGYIVINKTTDGRRQIKLHRYVMEQHIGRKLLPSEIVHHINEDKLDNRIDNLQIVTISEHNRIHGFLTKEKRKQ